MPAHTPDDAAAICASLRRQSDHYANHPRVDARPDDEDA